VPGAHVAARAGALLATLLGPACRFEAAIPDLVVTCAGDGDCPVGYRCRPSDEGPGSAGLCCRGAGCSPAAGQPAPAPAPPPGSSTDPAPAAPPAIAPLPPVFEGIFTLASRPSGRCLGVGGDGFLQAEACRSDYAQLFRSEQLSLGTYRLANVHSGGCLEVEGGAVEDGVKLRQVACQDDALEQSFRIDPSGGGHVLLVSLKSGRCLDAEGGPPGQRACNGTVGQDWLPSRLFLAAPHQLRVRHSGKCAQASMDAAAQAVLRQYPCTRADDQLFRVENGGGGRFAFVSVSGGTCLHVPTSQPVDGISIGQTACSRTDAPWFRIEGVGGGFDRIVNLDSGKCLAVRDSGGLDGAAIEQRTCSGADNQRWSIAVP
jgi:hypothetical protein